MEQDNDYYIIGWKQGTGPGGKEKKEGRIRKEVGSCTTQQVQEGSEEHTCKCWCSQITTTLLLLPLQKTGTN
jgi:hypothetical protein